MIIIKFQDYKDGVEVTSATLLSPSDQSVLRSLHLSRLDQTDIFTVSSVNEHFGLLVYPRTHIPRNRVLLGLPTFIPPTLLSQR